MSLNSTLILKQKEKNDELTTISFIPYVENKQKMQILAKYEENHCIRTI